MSQVNLILEPDSRHMTTYYVAAEIEDAWTIYSDCRHFQIGQIERFREASVFRFVDTCSSGVAVSGTIYIMGNQYKKLSDEHVKMGDYIDNWTGTISHQRFLASAEKYAELVNFDLPNEKED
ncbi:hypothetical protein UNDKW_3883 [Undibacterium sp. KW1]|nr:hypothetical protein UNDKW_3883 [Undibacterium sp. KW1]